MGISYRRAFFAIIFISGVLLLINNSKTLFSEDAKSDLRPITISGSKRRSTLDTNNDRLKTELDLTDDYISLYRADPLCKTTAKKEPIGQLKNPILLMHVLREYAEWHKNERKRLLSKDSVNIRTLIWHFKEYPQSSGLADKVRGITSALILAILSERLLFIQWSSQPFRTSRQRNIFKPNQINWDIDEEILTLIGKKATMDNPEFGPRLVMNKQSHEPEPSYLIERIFGCKAESQHVFLWTAGVGNHILSLVQKYNYIDQCSNYSERHKTGKINLSDQAMSEAYKFSEVFSRYLFNFCEMVLTRASEELKKIGIRVDQDYSVVHIRTGFYGLYNEIGHSHTWNVHNVTSEETWRGLVSQTIAKSAKSIGPSAPVLVLTDSDLVKEWVRREYKGSVKVTEGTVGHVGRREKDLTDDIEAVEYQTGAELAIMAHSSILVTSAGGFGNLAANLCSIPLN